VNAKAFVVVLEEDALIRRLLERWLREAGYRVAVALLSGNGPDAGARAPSLVIANVADPQTAGPAIESLHEVYAGPILVLSARFCRGLAGSAEAARRLGVDKVLPKPFTRKELLFAVREALEGAA
jgi:DNA-binding response OmpR family regulator